MKKIILTLIFVLTPIISFAQNKVPATLFYSSHCKVCIKLKTEFFPAIKQKYANQLDWKELNTGEDPEALRFLMSVAKQFNIKKPSVPSILVGNVFLTGKKEISQRLEDVIIFSLKQKTGHMPFIKADLVEEFKKWSAFTIIGNGLIDGINPCAFAVIVFFVSFLAIYGYRKREIIVVGSAYCLAVFMTYLLLGLGFFKFFYTLVGFDLLIKTFYYFVATFCFILAGLAIYDYIRFKKTGETDEMILQLPKFLKKKINLVIGQQLREKKERGIFGLIISSFVVGFLVSLLEAVCTGQVYLPTIVFILKNTNLRLKALNYLILYNAMFVLPLVIIFILSLLGFSSQKFNQFLKNNLASIKLLLFIVFFGLGMMILFLT